MSLSRRQALGLMAGAVPALSLRSLAADGPALDPSLDPANRLSPGIRPEDGPFQPTRASLSAYQCPDWFRDAKFGMWAHWGPQSAVEFGDWYARLMYLQGSEQYFYHCEHYGHPSTFGFKDTIPAWKAEQFDPAHLIGLYKRAGARYFMSMACHHDNFDLWDSKHNRWNAVRMGPRRNIVGEWSKAVRDAGLKFGVSEHLWITYKWYSVAHGSDKTGPLAGVPYDGATAAKDLYVDSDEVWNDLAWNEDQIPTWWKRHWYERITDLIDQHQPDFLYSDGSLPFQDYGCAMVAHLYNQSARRRGGRTEAVYFSKRLVDGAGGLCILDRERGVLDDILPRPWQCDTCIGNWHYKRGTTYKTAKQVIDQLCDIVSKNGNLMLNVPLPASGMPDLEELAVVAEITDWMAVNSEGIHGSRPWKRFGEGAPVQTAADSGKDFNESSRRSFDATDIRYTTKGGVLYAFVMGQPTFQVTLKSLATATALRVGKVERVELVGQDGAPLRFAQDPSGLTVDLPEKLPSRHAVALRIHGAIPV